MKTCFSRVWKKLHTHVDGGPRLGVFRWHVARLRVAAQRVGPLRDGEDRARRRASHDAPRGPRRGQHAQRARRADGMRAGPLLLVLGGLRRWRRRRGRGRRLKVQVGHLGQREGHLPGVTQRTVPVSHAALVGGGGTSQLQPGVLLLLLGVAVGVGPRLGQRGDGVQGEARRAVVGGRVGHLGVAAPALEAGPQVLAGRPAGVGGGAVVDVQQRRAAVHVGGETLQHRRASLRDGRVVGRGRDRGVALGDGGVAVGARRVTLVVDGRVALH